jgi:hypothetical protein
MSNSYGISAVSAVGKVKEKPPPADVPSLGSVVDGMRSILKVLPLKDTQDALKALCALYNLKAVSAFAPVGPMQNAPASRDTRGQVRFLRQPQADPKMKEIRQKIGLVNKKISKKSLETKVRLSETDPLIEERTHLFRDLKEAQNKSSASAKSGVQESK